MKENRIIITRMDANRLGDLIVEARNKGYRGSTYLNDLAAELDRALLVEPKDIPTDVITMNSQGRIARPGPGREDGIYPGIPRRCGCQAG